MSAQDYRVNALVRRHLVSRWIDVSRLQIGTTNGVVYLLGTFEPSVENALERAGEVGGQTDPTERLPRLMGLVEKELRRIRGVRDLVIRVRNLKKRNGAWNVVGATGADRSGVAQKVPAASGKVSVLPVDEPSIEEEGRKNAGTFRRS